MGKTSENDGSPCRIPPKHLAAPRPGPRHSQGRQAPAGHRALKLIAVVSAAQADVPWRGLVHWSTDPGERETEQNLCTDMAWLFLPFLEVAPKIHRKMQDTFQHLPLEDWPAESCCMKSFVPGPSNPSGTIGDPLRVPLKPLDSSSSSNSNPKSTTNHTGVYPGGTPKSSILTGFSQKTPSILRYKYPFAGFPRHHFTFTPSQRRPAREGAHHPPFWCLVWWLDSPSAPPQEEPEVPRVLRCPVEQIWSS